MALEIERKFLLRDQSWRAQVSSRTLLRQGYLNDDPARIVRVRVVGEAAFLTVKGITTDITRAEWEYPIPLDDANAMLAICQRPLIEKYRHLLEVDGMRWEIDEFLGENEGLIVAELELQNAAQSFTRPAWLGEEVSTDNRYRNSNLGRHPFTAW